MMISQHCQSSRLEAQISNNPRKIWHYVKRFAKRCKEWKQMKEQHQQLLRMSTHMLKDIGLSRADAVRLTKGCSFLKFMTEPESEHKKKRPRPSYHL